MLEGLITSRPALWTSQDLMDASATSVNRPSRTSSEFVNGGLPTFRGRSLNGSKAEQAPTSLSVSLDFLNFSDNQASKETTWKGRSGVEPGANFSPSHNTSSQDQTFWDSPELDSPVANEQEWRKTLVAEADPVHKSGHRSRSKESSHFPASAVAAASFIPSAANGVNDQYSSTYSPFADSSSPLSISSLGERRDLHPSELTSFALNRSASVPRGRPVQPSTHLAPWAVDSGSPLRRAIDFGSGEGNDSDHHPAAMNQSDRSNGGNGRYAAAGFHETRGSVSAQRSLSYQVPGNASLFSNRSSSSPDQNRSALASSPTGLATMHEESSNVDNLFQTTGVTTLRGNIATRHRSTSSAAALQYSDRAADSFNQSVSLWRGELNNAGPNPYGHLGSPQAQHEASPPSMAARTSHWERGRRNDYTGSAFANLPEELTGGSESRRHSIAADVGNSTLTGQRRAIGFEVSRPHASSTSRTSSMGRQAATPRATAGYGLFGGGGLAISEDDLAADLQHLQLNLDDVVAQRQEEEEQRRTRMRVPSSNAAVTGAHAASMPTDFGGHAARSDLGKSPPIGTRRDNWPVSARPRDDDAGSGWGEMLVSTTGQATGPNRGFTDWNPGLPSPAASSAAVRRDPSLGPTYPDGRTSTGLSATAQSFLGGKTAGFIPMGGGHHPAGGYPAPPSARQSSQEKSGEFVPSSPARQFQPFGVPPSTSSPTKTQPQQQNSVGGGSISNPAVTLSEVAIASLVTLGPLAPPSSGPNDGPSSLQELGKGVPLQMLPRQTTLYVVEFKEGRTDLYFRQQQGSVGINEVIRNGDLVIVEADRGKDLGTVVNDSITVEQVQGFLAQQAELTQGGGGGAGTGGDAPHPATIPLSRLTRSINPKRLFSKAGMADTSLLHSKAQDEERALTLCTTKVNQRGLPMTVVAAEMQWDRRKLTFYYTATQRVDFRDLVKELFRLYKTRIWMCHLSHPSGNSGMSS